MTTGDESLSLADAEMRKLFVASLGLVLLVLTAGWLLGFGPLRGVGRPISASEHGGIRSLQLVPFHEGPNSPLFERPPVPQGSLPLTAVEASTPNPLPAPSRQGFMCNMGGNLE
jgi:hypothetical protein